MSPAGSPDATDERTAALRHALRSAASLAARRRYSRAQALIDEALAEHERDDPAALRDRLQALRRAIGAERRLLVRRLVVIAAFLVCTLAVGFLQLTPVSSTEVVIELRTRGVLFTLAANAALDVAPVTAVLLSGGDEVSLNTGDIEVDPRFSGTEVREREHVKPTVRRPISIRGSQIRISGEELAVTKLYLPQGVPIEIRVSGGPSVTGTIRHGASLQAVLRTADSVVVECPDCKLEQKQTSLALSGRRFVVRPSPRELYISGTSSGSDMGLVLPPDSSFGEFRTQASLRVATIDFTDNAIGRPESLILGGTIRLADVDDETVTLAARDFLDLNRPEDLVVSRLVLGSELFLRLEGRVGGLTSGAGPSMHSRMPSRLEWLVANEPRKLFFASVAAVFGFLMAAAGRLGIDRSE